MSAPARPTQRRCAPLTCSLRAPCTTSGARVLASSHATLTATIPLSYAFPRRFNAEKGFGFVAPANGADDLFVHQSAIHAPGFRSLMEGEEVEFKVVDGGGKMKAEEVTGPNGDFVQGAPRGFQKGRGGGRM